MVGPLVSNDWLTEHLDAPAVVVIEVSFYAPAQAAYFQGHIPGARYVYWKDLLWHDTDREFASPEVMAARLGTLGVGDDTTAVLVGDPIQFATYAYWIITMNGLEERVTVLDGGHRTWAEQGRPLTDDEPIVDARVLRAGEPDASSRIGREEVRAGLNDPGRVLVDLRSGEEYRGERVAPLTAPFDHGAERRGHIPGSRHLPHDRLLEPDGTFKSRHAMRAEFDAVGATADVELVTTCRLSHRASMAWFVLTRLLGSDRVRVYDGSWTEWGSIVGFPVER
jgi:thiosulfate/3-mercaptopyruvate sulfurtransferase